MQAQRQVLFWLAAILVAVVALLVLKSVLAPFVTGIVIAYALNPIADRLERIGLPRTAASALIVAGLILVAVLAMVFLVPPLMSQLNSFLLSLPGELDRLRILAEGWAQERLGARFGEVKAGLDKRLSDLGSTWAALLQTVAASVWTQGLALFGVISFLLIVPLVVFYLLVDWHPMLNKIDSWLPRDHRPTVQRLASEVDGAIAAFVRGQGIVCVILGTFYAVGLSAIGLRYGLLIGIATGVLAFVPFVGWALGLITALVIATVQFWPETMPVLIVLAVFAAGQVLDAAILSPQIVGGKLGLHPVWLIFALAVFSSVFGFVGILVAVPLAAAFAVLIRFAIELYLGSDVYKGTAKPAALSEGKDTV